VIEDWRKLDRPNVGPKMYWKEIVFLLLALATPFISWFGWKDPKIFAASGSIMVFLSVLTEFWLLNRLNVKHINNVLRVQAGHKPLRFSLVAEVITWCSLVIAAIGTIIWGFGDRLF
jgi:phosphoglycerol transferase MdoB-like AlkP superfamily enzyme